VTRKIVQKQCLAGKDGSIESPTEPKWSPQGENSTVDEMYFFDGCGGPYS
jgi:hypothetical protein